MQNRFILCSECGTKNRIKDEEGTPKCGKCGKTLNVPRQSGLSKAVFSPAGLGIAGIIGFFVICALLDDSPKHSRQISPPAEYVPPAEPISELDSYTPHATIHEKSQIAEFNEPPIQIFQGVVHEPTTQGVAPLEIRTSSGSNYYAKLVDIYTDEEVMSMYIVGGVPFETLVPLGQYELRYAAGDTWYGEAYRFGPQTVYSKASSTFNFTRTYDGYSGYTVQLILQRNGNLRTQKINPENF